jgi:hypothetical protein
MKRTTIVLPPDLKVEAKRHARQLGISLGELIRQTLSFRLASSRHANPMDPLFADSDVFSGPGPGDVAAHHDQHLYGDSR